VAIATGLGYAFGVMITGGISGGLMNPALTLAMGLFARVRLSFVPVFWAAQYLGAFFGATIVGFVYRGAMKAVDCQFDPDCSR
jgi:aquaglyceroporin related protein